MEKTVEKLTDFIRDVVKRANAKGVVVGLSGGIDSSVVATLCVKALGRDKVLGVIMPERDTDPRDVEHAKRIAEKLGIKYILSDITDVLKAFGAGGYVPTREFDKIADGNLKARIRMCILYYFANKRNLLVAGTSNKSELYMGYGTKYGDLASDFLVIGNLFKSEVRELARYLGVPQEIIDKPPSAGLWKGQRDEEELGISYELLDKILERIERGEDKEKISKDLDIPLSQVEEVLNRIESNRHKLGPIFPQSK
ncbi:MAG TPA: NAD+ synthase [Methanothermococcus okinawensis]|uniref:NH(3)-dependent NAD(+) synthetase n=1 Tax=Methanothermococcus okinawensis TaxID=155863 RepID=A0A832ZBR8_9EURY|nr:NAD+ synthase [Methanococcaceae archaeon]HIP84506.1 NAD+ synthase [Methanothermococcus okinawensis]HIP91079.1 NAD+ synthase [Methanothermococcus okinawensis]